MPITNEVRREIMLQAWAFQRAEPSRAFGDCLRGAWKLVRGLASAAKKLLRLARRSGGRVCLSSSLIHTPIGAATATARHPGRADWRAARTTGRLGV